MAKPDLWRLYAHMLRSRFFEAAVTRIWKDGLISGEMHLSTGEEAITAGIVSQLQEGDALALDHRGTSALVVRGVDLGLLLREFMGHPRGLCGGQGGHMHLFSKDHLAASSGIVGASGPAAVGFALAAKHLRPQGLAVAFFGEGAMNQGMLLESLNLAVVWRLPVIFVCKDSKWAITTVSASVTGGDLAERAGSFGMPVLAMDGNDVEVVWKAARRVLKRARDGKGPAFILATCHHPEGHFLGDQLVSTARHPVREIKKMARSLIKSATRGQGASLAQRVGSLGKVTALIGKTQKEQLFPSKDPLRGVRRQLRKESARLQTLEIEIQKEIQQVVGQVVGPSRVGEFS